MTLEEAVFAAHVKTRQVALGMRARSPKQHRNADPAPHGDSEQSGLREGEGLGHEIACFNNTAPRHT